MTNFTLWIAAVQTKRIDLVNAVPDTIPIIGAPAGSQLLTIAADVTPASGTVTVTYTVAGDPTFRTLRNATARSMTAGPVVLRVEGPVNAVRITFADLPGGAGSASVWIVPQPVPLGLFEGTCAMTVQPYTEANVKNGLQYYGRAVWPLGDEIASGTTRKLWFKTGAKMIIVKLREIHYVAEELRVQLFIGPTGVIGGTPLVVHNYNSVNPVATTVLAAKNVTTVSDGVQFDGSDPEHLFGTTATGQRAAGAIPQGRERIIPPNSEFIVAITNTGTGTARVQYYLDWYEGEPDLPL